MLDISAGTVQKYTLYFAGIVLKTILSYPQKCRVSQIVYMNSKHWSCVLGLVLGNLGVLLVTFTVRFRACEGSGAGMGVVGDEPVMQRRGASLLVYSALHYKLHDVVLLLAF